MGKLGELGELASFLPTAESGSTMLPVAEM
jgi:hypothetical protein